MSQAKKALHKLSISQKGTNAISTGANTRVKLDGKDLWGVKFLKLEFHSRRVTKVQIEMFVEVEDIEVDVPLNMQEVKAVSKNYITADYTSEDPDAETVPLHTPDPEPLKKW